MTVHVSQDLRHTLDELGSRFLREFLEVEIRRHPDNVDALAELGQVYTNRGEWEAGLRVDLRLVELVPHSSTAYYNLACSYALLGRTQEALDGLDQAVELGYDDAEFMCGDEDLASLREEQRFRSLLERIRPED